MDDGAFAQSLDLPPDPIQNFLLGVLEVPTRFQRLTDIDTQRKRSGQRASKCRLNRREYPDESSVVLNLTLECFNPSVLHRIHSVLRTPNLFDRFGISGR